MSKFMLIGGGLVAGTGFTTGVAGLTVMGMNESESDLMRKKVKIEEEKLKVQGEIVKLNEQIEQLKAQEKILTERKSKSEDRKKAIVALGSKLIENIRNFSENLNKNDQCYDLDLSQFLKDADASIKNEDWFKDVEKEYKFKKQFGKGCPETL